MNAAVSVTIIACNEERAIRRALDSVRWADEVIVVDSGSSDRTVEIAEFLGARVLRNPWPGYGQQKNFAQDQARGPWILNIDADEWVSPTLAEEIRRVVAAPGGAVGFTLPRRTYYLGRWIRHGGWYPNRLVRLARKDSARWSEPPVHESLQARGAVGALDEALDHDAFSSIREQVLTNLRYSALGSEELTRRGRGASALHLVLKPVGKFFETYFIKRGFLDGWAGLIISVNAAHSVFLKYAYLFEPRIRARGQLPSPDKASPS